LIFSIAGDPGVKVNDSLDMLGAKELINRVSVMGGIQEAFAEGTPLESPCSLVKGNDEGHTVMTPGGNHLQVDG